nr:response regulator [Sedimentibacter sp.]
MLKIAICDNDYKACSYLESILLNYSKSNNLIIECEVFYSGEELCHYLKQNYLFDLIFLEIEMNQLNGIEIGKKIRNELNNHTTQIIYISTKYDYAPYLFKTKPLDFFVKPLHKSQIIDSIDMINEYLYTEKIFFEFSYNRTFTRFLLKTSFILKTIVRRLISILKSSHMNSMENLQMLKNKFPIILFGYTIHTLLILIM